MSEIILNPAAASPAIPKRVTLRTRAGSSVSMDVTLQDAHGRKSAAEYIHHLHNTIRTKLGEITRPNAPAADEVETLKTMILYIAAFHDSFFGSFNEKSRLPDDERTEFVEIFLLAIATLIPGRNILVDLGSGKVSGDAGLS
jgi:hypothetical protein